MKIPTPCLALALLLPALPLQADPSTAPIGWRTDGTGHYPNTDPPTSWSTENHVQWKTTLPDWGNGMPVLHGDRIYLCTEPHSLLALSATDGTVLWSVDLPVEAALSSSQRTEWETNQDRIQTLENEIAALTDTYRNVQRRLRGADDSQKAAIAAERDALAAKRDALTAELNDLGGFLLPQTHPDNGYTSATPVTDSERIFVLFGTGVIGAFDHEGNRLWAGFHEQPTHGFGHSTSPLLIDDKLIVHVQSMIAYDAATGEPIWQAEVPSGFGTPAVTRVGDTTLLITSHGNIIRASDGAILAERLFRLPYGSPIVHDQVIYAVDETGGIAIELPDSIDGDSLTLTERWRNKPPHARYYSSPLVHDGLLYAINQQQTLSAIDIATGEIVYSETIDMGAGQQLYGSISLAGGLLFMSHDNGTTAVVRPGRTFELVSINPLEPTRSTPVFRDDHLFFRTDHHLFRLGNTAE